MKANTDKCHLLITANEERDISIGVEKIQVSKSEKLHWLNARLSSLMSLEKRRLIMRAFVSSQFGYCPIIWIFHNRTLNNRINRIRERALRILYCDKMSNFTKLLQKKNAATVHQRNLQVLAIEVY